MRSAIERWESVRGAVLAASKYLSAFNAGQPSGSNMGIAEKRGILSRLSDATLAAVLKDLGAERLEDVPSYDGPLPLRLELTDGALPAGHVAVPAPPDDPAQRDHLPKPDAITSRHLRPEDGLGEPPVDYSKYGVVAGPVLAVSNRQPGENFGPPFQFDSSGNTYPLRANDPTSFRSWLPVRNWRDQPGYEYLHDLAKPGPAI